MAKTRKRAGDRRDGRLLRSLPAFCKFIPFIMPTRNDARTPAALAAGFLQVHPLHHAHAERRADLL